jgi:hypothetical protein
MKEIEISSGAGWAKVPWVDFFLAYRKSISFICLSIKFWFCFKPFRSAILGKGTH